MKAVEETARSVEEAVQQALQKLGVSADDVEVEVLEEPSRGFMGFLGGRPARVKVAIKENTLDRAQSFLTQVVSILNVDVNIKGTTTTEGIQIDIEGKNVGTLIGRRGQALDAWQYLTNLVANKGVKESQRVMLDIAGYRARRTQTLTNLAKRTAERVKDRRRQIALEPMSAAERRIIHLTLQDDPEIETASEGREPFRRVVISAKRRS
ncbi:MAG: RNA-binding cell elongation regulator Jag/EloR [bacterium]|jgi:spoIIIJ-associated protein